MRMLARVSTVVVVTAGVLVPFAVPSAGASNGVRTYRVTITNLTRGQPFTPPVVATHRGRNQIFALGVPASLGVQQIAENGDNSVELNSLAHSRRVSSSLQAGNNPLVPASRTSATGKPDQVTFTITSRRGFDRLSVVMMLICTNDGFTGINSLTAPAGVGDSRTVFTNAYDAGTEQDTQRFADMVPPCRPLITGGPLAGTTMSNPSLAEGDVIRHHAGIQAGVGDLDPATFGWTDPVAKIKIKRIG